MRQSGGESECNLDDSVPMPESPSVSISQKLTWHTLPGQMVPQGGPSASAYENE